MAPTSLEKAERSRESAKSTIEYIMKLITDHPITPIDQPTLTKLIEMLDKAETKLCDSYTTISQQGVPDMDPFTLAHFAIVDQILKAHSKMEGIKATFAPVVVPPPIPIPTPMHQFVRLPSINLPTFDGNIQNWVAFKDMFTASVHNNTTLTRVQKFTYLRSSLTGEAARQVTSLAVTNANYDVAWDQLAQRYHNDRELLFSTLWRLTGQPATPGNSATSLRALIDVSKECIHSLISLKLPVDQWDAILLFLIAIKLDNTTREMWEQSLTSTAIPTLKSFLDFLEQRARALAAGGISKAVPRIQPGKQFAGSPRKVAHAHHAASALNCRLCKGTHATYKCSTFVSMQVAEKSEVAKKYSLCYNCLGEGHSVSNCPSQGTCRTCNGKHHTLLHRGKSPQPAVRGKEPTARGKETPAQPPAPEKESEEFSLGQHTSNNVWNTGMLATALVQIQDQRGQLFTCRAFLDGGATTSFITEACVRRLGLNRTRNSAEIRGLASTAIGTARGIVSIEISSLYPGNPSYSVYALVLPVVTARLPVKAYDPTKWPHLKGLQLADPKFYKPDTIDILLGSDVFYNCLMNESKRGPRGCPAAIKSTFGWLVAGETNANSSVIQVNYNDVDMEKQLHKLWEIETVSTTRVLTKEEQDCEAHFQSTHKVNNEGRFIVKLPRKHPQPVLGSSRDMAVRQLKQLEGRFNRAPDKHEQYRKFMQEYLSLGHMEKIPESEIFAPASQACYIPHHFVCKESSLTTKLRVVFNASFKTSTGISLNDTLMVGPTIQDTMTDILMRFRIHPIAFKADVAKMYRQVLVSPVDTDLQRIVWRDSPSESIKDYRLLTVTYGTGPAPFLATRALQQLARNHSARFPLASQAVMNDVYVDDLMSGSFTLKIAIKTVVQTNLLMKEGGMEFRQWSSNSPALLDSIAPELRATQQLLPLDDDVDQTVKTLGVFWDPVRDQCSFKVTVNTLLPGSQLTKRHVLSEISKIFDPLGWLSPVIIKARILIQQLWKLQLGWDEPLPQDIQQQWITYRDTLYHLEEIFIPRCMVPDDGQRTQLAGFCDASEKAYSAVVYLCVYSKERAPVISMVASKVRVAPAKTVSLPRLELCGALLLSQLINNVQRNVGISRDQTNLWTDSTVVLAWIQAHPSRWKTFVANRVTEIQERTSAKSWGHVLGTDNPADCASRGLNPIELKHHPLWWNGASFIQTEDFTVDSEPLSTDDITAVRSEEKSEVIVNLVTINENSLLYQYSSLSKLNRVSAFIYRFYTNCLIKVQTRKNQFPCKLLSTGPLTPVEIDAAFLSWIRSVQAEQFSREISSLVSNQPTHPKDPLRALNPFVDSDGLLRVGGRLRNSPLPLEHREPILLPRHHHLTKLLIMSEHLKYLHAGPALLLSIIHRRFWIVRARDAVRHQIKKCVKCTRVSAVTLQQFMGDFPAARVTPSRAFLKCGVDYAGPFLIKPITPRSKTSLKSYLAVFVCFATHAIHIEVVSSLSTPAFIQALTRFISRRGKPSDMYSDCGTNFIGADKELKEVAALLRNQTHNQLIADKLVEDGIQWHFNPPGAPHFGGLWEAGVKSVKFHLKRVIGLSRLTFEELATVLTQVEACLNSRPLTPISTDPNDFSALTPGHFLIGSPLVALPQVDLRDQHPGRLSRWQHVQQLHQHFWHRWSNEFIARLQQRPKWQNHRKELKLGDLVIIKDDRLPPLKWQLGRVFQLHPGADGLTRVVTLRTSGGEMKRPIIKLCLLPIDSTPNSTEAPSV